jgi:hypothetical protein
MTIAYYLHLNYGRESGVYRKVIAQVRNWKDQGETVCLFLTSSNRQNPADFASDLPGVSVVSEIYKAGISTRALFQRFRALLRSCRKVSEWHPDIVYMRHDFVYPGLLSMARQNRLILEINTHDLAETKLMSRVRYIWQRFTRKILLTNCTGAVFMTRELMEDVSFRSVAVKTTIANGFPMETVDSGGAVSNGEISLVFIGSAGLPWHGVDKLVPLACAFPKWQLNLIGVSAAEAGSKAPDNMRFLGHLERRLYAPLLREATAGIGTLALHRKSMTEACVLKTREYLAYGLPVILGYKDTDLTGTEDFVCQLPNTENNVSANISKIGSFVEKWNGRKVPKSEVMQMDASAKEQLRMAFFQQCMRGQHK